MSKNDDQKLLRRVLKPFRANFSMIYVKGIHKNVSYKLSAESQNDSTNGNFGIFKKIFTRMFSRHNIINVS